MTREEISTMIADAIRAAVLQERRRITEILETTRIYDTELYCVSGSDTDTRPRAITRSDLETFAESVAERISRDDENEIVV